MLKKIKIAATGLMGLSMIASSGAALAHPHGNGGYGYQNGGYYQNAGYGYSDDDDYYRQQQIQRARYEQQRRYEQQQRYYNDGYNYNGYNGYPRRCNKGTTGLVVGAVVGGLLGRSVVGWNGDRTAGAIVGAGAGALAGRAIERSGSRC